MKRNTEACPLCGADSAFYDCDSVDVGVGVIEGNRQYTCPTHGEWCAATGGIVFREPEWDEEYAATLHYRREMDSRERGNTNHE